MNLHFGKLIKENIDKHNLSVNVIAEKTQKHRQTVYSDFKKESLNTDVIEQYCAAIGISFQELVCGTTLNSELHEQLSECQRQLTFSNQLMRTKDELIASLKAQLDLYSKFSNSPSSSANAG